MNGDDITSSNPTMPLWPKGMKLRHKILCLFGYHLRETRKTGPMHKYPGMKLRDQCGRCGVLL
jgi:hypothetical protein